LPQAAGYTFATRGVWWKGGSDTSPPERLFVDVYPGP